MRRYAMTSGVFFSLVSLAQLIRAVMGWPARVDGVNVSVWWSVLACAVTGSFAIWGFRELTKL
jgi:hypothetical protein